jgi:hypothetical protein
MPNHWSHNPALKIGTRVTLRYRGTDDHGREGVVVGLTVAHYYDQDPHHVAIVDFEYGPDGSGGSVKVLSQMFLDVVPEQD